MPSIGVYSIFLNESTNGDIDRWIACATEGTDAVVVVDTGSTDDTVDRLLAAGIEVHCAKIVPFRFDTAWNTALALLPDVDIAVRLDGDETIVGRDGPWVTPLVGIWQDGLSRINLRNINHSEAPGAWGEYWRGFDVHARHGLRWKYPTHEALLGSQAALDVHDVEIHHWPRLWRQVHHDTNVTVLAQAHAEDPHDERMAFYYGRECTYPYVNDWVAARKALMHFLALPTATWDAERAEAYRLIASMDDFPETWIWKAIGECPQRRESWCDLVNIRARTGDIVGAELALAEAERRTDRRLYTTDAAYWDGGFEDLKARLATLARVGAIGGCPNCGDPGDPGHHVMPMGNGIDGYLCKAR